MFCNKYPVTSIWIIRSLSNLIDIIIILLLKLQNVLHNTRDMGLKVFYGKCSNTSVRKQLLNWNTLLVSYSSRNLRSRIAHEKVSTDSLGCHSSSKNWNSIICRVVCPSASWLREQLQEQKRIPFLEGDRVRFRIHVAGSATGKESWLRLKNLAGHVS